MALSWALHDVSPSSLQPGDHVYRWSSLVHVHHGIVLEKPADDMDLTNSITVLHIPTNGGVEAKQETLATFLGKGTKGGAGSLKSARYGVPPIEVWIKRSGTCYAEQSSPVNEVVARALSLLQKSQQHCVFRAFRGATSEDIAFWCKTGKCQAAVPVNNTGGTNYDSQQIQGTTEAAQYQGSTEAPQATSSTAEAATPVVAEEADGKVRTLSDPDAFLLLDESQQQNATPQSVRQISVPDDDADLDDYEVVDLPPWLPAEHYPAAVNVA